jgi:DNA invertase Pin-like site-specific DNA recombinase
MRQSQIDALKKSGSETIFQEIAKGARQDRSELNKLLEIIKEGDSITIWKLDRLGRSLHHLIKIVN